MGKPEIYDCTSLSGKPVKAISVRLRPEQDMHDIEPIAKSIAREIGMGRVDVLDYMWSDKAQAWAVFVQKRISLIPEVKKQGANVPNQKTALTVTANLLHITVGVWL